MDALDSIGDAGGEGHLEVVVVWPGGAVVAKGYEEKLAVGVPVDVPLDAGLVADPLGMADESLVLNGIAGGLALVVVGAGVGGRAGAGPLVGPVAVDICADAGTDLANLAVLAP